MCVIIVYLHTNVTAAQMWLIFLPEAQRHPCPPLCAPLWARPTPAFAQEGNGVKPAALTSLLPSQTFHGCLQRPQTPWVFFPPAFSPFVPSPWPPPGPWSTCLRAPPPAPHYHMNAGREGPAEAWTPTEGNGFAILPQQHILPFPVYWEWNCHQYDWGWREGQMCIHTLMSRVHTHLCARVCVCVCVLK